MNLKGENMTLPRPKKRKLINRAKFVKLAKKVKESFEEELKYLREKKLKNEAFISSNTHSYP